MKGKSLKRRFVLCSMLFSLVLATAAWRLIIASSICPLAFSMSPSKSYMNHATVCWISGNQFINICYQYDYEHNRQLRNRINTRNYAFLYLVQRGSSVAIAP